MAVQDLARIEDKIDRVVAGSTEISMGFGGVTFHSFSELMEFSKCMSISQAAVPSHLRGNVGACLAICTRALRWGFDPFAVAEKSYLVNNKGEERIAFESQLLHAVIEAHAPITGRLRFRYEGEGEERRCVVYATPKGEKAPLEYRSEPIAKLRPARNEYGKIKGSPLWETKPDMQLFYSASRDWCRTYFPDTLMGVYTKDEMEETPAERAVDVTPKPDIASRLKGPGKTRGFSAAHVEQQTTKPASDPAQPETKAAETTDKTTTTTTEEPTTTGEPDGGLFGESESGRAV